MTAPPYAVPVPRGYRVGPWEVREPIASGAFATVYEATRDREPKDERDGRDGPDGRGVRGTRGAQGARGAEDSRDGGPPLRAALKFLPTGTRTPRQLEHLRDLAEREVQLLRRLRSPRLIRMYDTLTVDDPDHPELDGATVLVLERAEGSLDALLARTAVPDAGPALLAQVCEGLHQLHHAGWVHGDLKPANVLLMADGSARLADFNMAAEMQGTHAYTPAFATPDYTPPELLWPVVDERGTRIRPSADVWAFGVLAHVVLTGEFPLPGASAEARADAATRYARGTEGLRLSPALPDAWRDILHDCLAPDHRARATGTEDLLRRVEAAAGAARSARLPRLRPRRWTRPALVTALAAAVAGTAALLLASPWDPDAAAAEPPTCERPVLYEDASHRTGYMAGNSGTWDFTIQRGDGGSQVRELQCLLRYLHGVTEVGEVDGDFGPMTHQAVVTFQTRAGLDADGMVGPATWRALRRGPAGS